ncbi:ATP-binding protein, partial [bacterium]|nr:ATP-binding protein [bacterium]
RLTRDVRDEWAKIQGRFVDLPLNVAGEELIDLIGRAIKSDIKPTKVSSIAKDTAEHISNWRRVHVESLAKSLTQCWPLHPVTAALLGPISRRRFGQNQRSVFGFLNSAEPSGFQDFLKTTPIGQDNLYNPAELWDYLKANLEPSIMASPDGHKWSLAVDALFRAEAMNDDQNILDVLKCISLMDLFQERSGLSPEESLLALCMQKISAKELEQILNKLTSQSIICYRKHKKAYSLHQGSDFDIDAATEEAHKQTPALDFDRIRQAARFQPVVAKKHYHETGALRWFDVDLVPAEQAQKVAEAYQPSEGSIGLVMIVLGSPESGNVEKICRTASSANKEWPVFVSGAKNSWLIRSHAQELQALEWIRSNNHSLGGDTVARREVESRLAKTKDSLEEHLSGALSSGKWYIDGNAGSALTFRELHALASEKADVLYPQSPKINSELINRIKPSSNSVSALKALLKAMIECQGKNRLGIEGYPAEGGLFETLLASSGLYGETGEGLIFKLPTPKNDTARIRPLWEAADRFFKKNQNRAIPITELYKIWSEKPYGVKEGLLPFFAVSYLMTRQH